MQFNVTFYTGGIFRERPLRESFLAFGIGEGHHPFSRFTFTGAGVTPRPDRESRFFAENTLTGEHQFDDLVYSVGPNLRGPRC